MAWSCPNDGYRTGGGQRLHPVFRIASEASITLRSSICRRVRASRDNAEIDYVRFVDDSMKESRSVARWQASARQGFVVACVVGSLLLGIQPVHGHGDVKGDAAMPDTSSAAGPQMTVYRSTSCGCCTQWGAHIASAGFRIDDHVTEDMNDVKQEHGVSSQQASCHTADVEGFVIEGHVPASAIQRLLRERPNIRGLAVPGMPMSSPGMEVPGVEAEPFEVLAINHDGTTSVFARY